LINNLDTDQAALDPQFVRTLTGAQFDIFAYICMLLGNRDVAKDILQDTNVMPENMIVDELFCRGQKRLPIIK
jgi:transcriptional regulator of aromatic amino acid metabolism